MQPHEVISICKNLEIALESLSARRIELLLSFELTIKFSIHMLLEQNSWNDNYHS